MKGMPFICTKYLKYTMEGLKRRKITVDKIKIEAGTKNMVKYLFILCLIEVIDW